MDAFFVSVEIRDNPSLINFPVAVGGNSKTRGVISTCNYIARTYGVRSAMPTIVAMNKCPSLILLPSRMDAYKEASKQIRTIFERYTDIIEPLSLDEAYLDVTHSEHCHGSATLIAQQIRSDIFKELNLTASAGIAPNKFLAKIASDENKPNGQCVITPDEVKQFVEYLPLKKISGIGPKTSEKLKKYGFETCKDIRESSLAELSLIMGKFAQVIYERSYGIDNRPLEISKKRKSLAVEKTFTLDLCNTDDCMYFMNELFIKLEKRLNLTSNKAISKQGIKLKFSDFNQTTVEQQSNSCNKLTFDMLLIKALDRSNNRKVRLIGLSLGFKNFDDRKEQLSFCFDG